MVTYGRRRSWPGRSYRTSYYSTRRYPGFYRSSSQYALKGRARRFIRRNRGNIRRLIRGIAEHKYFIFQDNLNANTANNINQGGIVVGISDNVSQGATFEERIGDKITGTSLQMIICATPTALSTQITFVIWRFTCFIWKDDTTPTIGQIFDTSITNTFGLPIWCFHPNYKVKYKILCDYIWDNTALNSATVSPLTVWKPSFIKRISINLTKVRGGLNVVNFQPASTTGVNNIWYIVVNSIAGTTGVATNTTWNFSNNWKYGFIDL